MEIKSIRMMLKNNPQEPKLKAICDINLDDKLVIHGVRLIGGKKGLFLSFPSVIEKQKYHDIVHPIDAEFREQLSNAAKKKYAEVVENGEEEQGQND